jgi:hypothetical protein
MPELPFLVFAPPEVTTRRSLGGGGSTFRRPTPAEQRQRLEASFAAIANSFQDLQTTVAGVDPEQVIVLETLTESVANVAKAAARVPGLEWLAERDLDDVPPELGFADETEPGASLPRRLYALMSSQQAMDQLLALWREWTQNPTKRAKQGFGPFKHLFELLRDIRRWSPADRVAETGILRYWQEAIAIDAMIGFEVEFWFRAEPAKRRQAYAEIERLVQELGGQCLDQAAIPEILYHAALVEMPGRVVERFLTEIATGQYPPLLRSQGVMFFRPRAQSAFGLRPFEEVPFDLEVRLREQPAAEGVPVVAIFDGLPLENHGALGGRLVVDDPDEHRTRYQVAQQQHGTAIASLVVHGDLHDNGPALQRPVYIRPVFLPDQFRGREITPLNRLLVDLIHQAVRRLFEGDGTQPPVAPGVRIINLSLGDADQPFDRDMSPLGRLVDWLSWQYKVLIVVSIGNRDLPLALDAGWQQASDDDLVSQVLRGMQRDQYRRRPLSPAEAINCISVGAVHTDACPTFDPGPRVDLLRGRRLPSPVNTVASGFRRSTKPEILFPGGRLLFRQDPANPALLSSVDTAGPPGVLTAAPGLAPMELNRVRYSCGTSNSAALAARSAAQVYERLSTLQLPDGFTPLGAEDYTVLLKSLVVHGASWGAAAAAIDRAFPGLVGDWRALRRLKQQFLGYGEVDMSRCLSCTEQRATLLGWGRISNGEGHEFALPLPPSLAASTELRRLTVTLAWLTPTNQRHSGYRKAQLWIDVPGDVVGTQTSGLDALSARRGTVEHRVFEGADAVPFLDGDRLRILVSCREDAGKLEDPIAYGLAVTLEVAAAIAIDIYQEISARIRPVVEVEATP